MNKNIKIVLISVVLIAICSTGGFFLYKNISGRGELPVESGDTGSDEPIREEGMLAKDIVVQEVKVENYTDNRYIYCIYPKIINMNSKEFENFINKQIATNINEYRNEIEYIVDDETLPTAMYKYVTSYSRYNSFKYLSLVIDQDYQTGGIRSNKWKDIYNINAETSRIFYLEELFEPGIKYEESIIAEIKKQAEAKNIELVGVNNTLSKKQKFYIKDSKLVIYYDPSEVAATAFGELHFEMPFIMNEKGYFELSQD